MSRSELVPPWMYKEALCAEIGGEVFFMDDKNSDKPRQADYTQAKKICNSCPHLKSCFEWALRKEKHGLWGGSTPLERINERRKRGIRLEEDMALSDAG